MTDQQFKERCEDLKTVIFGIREKGIFKGTWLKGTWYVYNTISNNIIYKHRHMGRVMGIQYRPTSIYAEVMKTIVPTSYPIRRLASPNMVRHVRDVRARI
jgi:hypothetical protein